ncbi:MAG TPA: rubrerythrin [Nitrospiraceae bacterium]|nr:rubrerythrin [Nitrospiraceae bacterium]HCL81917.1 rubrerythrin [Nitrospiraceae bacterium]
MNAVEIAIKMETDAIRFYKEAAEKCSHPVGKKMFLSIREDEKRHLEMLSRIFKGLDIKIKDTGPMKNIKTIFEQMKDEMMDRVEAKTDELEAFKIAMRMEKEGIEFYKKAASDAPSEKEKKLFERLVHEEEQHYAVFANTYFFMQDSGSWFMWEEHSIVDGGTPWA